MDDLWAIGYDDMERAGQVKNEVVRLRWDGPYLILSAVAVVVRHPDGSFMVDREPCFSVRHPHCVPAERCVRLEVCQHAAALRRREL